MSIGATHIDHIVVTSNDSAATAKLFAENFDIEIKRTMSRPGTRAHLEFAKLQEVVIEFAGPGEVQPYDEVRAKLGGFVLAVPDIDLAVADPLDDLLEVDRAAAAFARFGFAHVNVHDGRTSLRCLDRRVSYLLGGYWKVGVLRERVTGT